jgi:hypothetical protein
MSASNQHYSYFELMEAIFRLIESDAAGRLRVGFDGAITVLHMPDFGAMRLFRLGCGSRTMAIR